MVEEKQEGGIFCPPPPGKIGLKRQSRHLPHTIDSLHFAVLLMLDQTVAVLNIDVFSMLSCIATSRLVHNCRYIQNLLAQLSNSHEIL